jgi:hypothetical protein
VATVAATGTAGASVVGASVVVGATVVVVGASVVVVVTATVLVVVRTAVVVAATVDGTGVVETSRAEPPEPHADATRAATSHTNAPRRRTTNRTPHSL